MRKTFLYLLLSLFLSCSFEKEGESVPCNGRGYFEGTSLCSDGCPSAKNHCGSTVHLNEKLAEIGTWAPNGTPLAFEAAGILPAYDANGELDGVFVLWRGRDERGYQFPPEGPQVGAHMLSRLHQNGEHLYTHVLSDGVLGRPRFALAPGRILVLAQQILIEDQRYGYVQGIRVRRYSYAQKELQVQSQRTFSPLADSSLQRMGSTPWLSLKGLLVDGKGVIQLDYTLGEGARAQGLEVERRHFLSDQLEPLGDRMEFLFGEPYYARPHQKGGLNYFIWSTSENMEGHLNHGKSDGYLELTAFDNTVVRSRLVGTSENDYFEDYLLLAEGVMVVGTTHGRFDKANTTAGSTVFLSFTSVETRCGDGVVQPHLGEECDWAKEPFVTKGASCKGQGYTGGKITCSPQCTLSVMGCERCGDQLIQSEIGEECDGKSLSLYGCQDFGYDYGEIGCRSDCRADLSGCVDLCGNGIVNESFGEECDGAHLGGESCRSLGWYGGGTLSCTEQCQFNQNGCSGGFCGDGVLQTKQGESCDGAVGLSSCGDLNYLLGQTSCNQCQLSHMGCGMESMDSGQLDEPVALSGEGAKIVVLGNTEGFLTENVVLHGDCYQGGCSDPFLMVLDAKTSERQIIQWGSGEEERANALLVKEGVAFVAGRTAGYMGQSGELSVSAPGNDESGRYRGFVTAYGLNGVHLWTQTMELGDKTEAVAIYGTSWGEIKVLFRIDQGPNYHLISYSKDGELHWELPVVLPGDIKAVAGAEDGSLYVLSSSALSPRGSALLRRFDQTGETALSMRLAEGASVVPRALRVDGENVYVLLSEYSDSQNSEGSWDNLLYGIHQSGSVQWVKRWGVPEDETPRALSQDKSGDLLVLTSIDNHDVVAKLGGATSRLLKMDKKGRSLAVFSLTHPDPVSLVGPHPFPARAMLFGGSNGRLSLYEAAFKSIE